MRLPFYVAVFLILEQFTSTVGFSVVSTSSRRQSSLALSAEPEASTTRSTTTYTTPETNETKRTTRAAIVARARKVAGLPDEEEEDAPKRFDQILSTLEKRVNDGPGSLSLLEVEEFQRITDRFLVEMKEKEAEQVGSLLAATPPPTAAPALAGLAPVVLAAVQMDDFSQFETLQHQLGSDDVVARRRLQQQQPKSPKAEADLAAKYAAIPSLEERAFTILVELGMVEEAT